MLRLTLLGGLSLTGNGQPLGPVASHPRRLALLAALAAVGERGIARDRLLLLFWPDSDTKRARAALKQTVFALRRDSAIPDLILGTAQLRLNRERVSCDVWELKSAFASGDWDHVARLYAGPFLEGVHLDGAGEFDQWAESVRDELRRRYTHALEELARLAGAQGAHRAAVDWWRRLVGVEPLNSSAALGLTKALATGGDRAGALRCADLHQALLRSELDLPPDPDIAAVVANLRASKEKQGNQPPVKPDLEPRLAAIKPNGERLVDPSRRRSRRSIWVGVTTGGMALISALAFARHRQPRLDDNLVAVMPFQVASSSPALANIDNDLVVLFWTKLTGDAGPRAVDLATVLASIRHANAGNSSAPTLDQELAAARRLGAGSLIIGAASGTAARVEVTAYLHDVARGTLRTRYTVAGPLDQLPALVDSLSSVLVAATYGINDDEFPSLARVRPAALREFLAGFQNSGLGLSRQYDAEVHFANAQHADSTFALAGLLAYDMGEWDTAAARFAWDHRDHLSERDRLLLEALSGTFRVPGWSVTSDRVNALEGLVARYPDWPKPADELADTYLAFGAYAGLSNWEHRARELLEHLLAVAPENGGWAEQLLEVTASAEDTDGVRRAIRLAATTTRGPADAWYMRWRGARFLGDRTEVDRVWRVLDTLPDGPWVSALYGIGAVARVDGRGLQDAEHAVRRLRALGEPLVNFGDEEARVAYAAGHYRDYLARRDEFLVTQKPMDAAVWRLEDALYRGATDSDIAAPLRFLENVRTGRTHSRLPPTWNQVACAECWLAQWTLALGHEDGVAAAIRHLRAVPKPQRYADCVAVLQLRLSERHGGDVQGAVRSLDSVARLFPREQSELGTLDNLIVAQTLIDLGDGSRALQAARRRCYNVFCGGVLWPSQILTEARALVLIGDRTAARRAYDHYLLLRQHAEGPWRAELDSAIAERGRLALEGQPH
ncbi:MAG TPA: BTAD domain-containing putative transcriptional regulator [Gemmatimonadales bacterium]|nr:BTAD domain-containing putative transcriptional regulator [Gemmatimonadales bacterium]